MTCQLTPEVFLIFSWCGNGGTDGLSKLDYIHSSSEEQYADHLCFNKGICTETGEGTHTAALTTRRPCSRSTEKPCISIRRTHLLTDYLYHQPPPAPLMGESVAPTMPHQSLQILQYQNGSKSSPIHHNCLVNNQHTLMAYMCVCIFNVWNMQECHGAWLKNRDILWRKNIMGLKEFWKL